ncbi:MAG: SRPBCC family protein [Myxococcota bacterium]
MLSLILALASAEVPNTPPEPLVLTDDESAQIAKGKVPVRFTDGGTSGGVVGFVDIAASEDAVWNAVMDVRARVGEISGLKEANVTLDTPTKKGVQWVLSVFGSKVQFHIDYDLDPSHRWCRYRLDTSKENDLVDVQGAYQIYRVGEKTRLVYRSETESGRSVPGFVKRWLASDSLTEQLVGIKARAERR